MKTYQEEYYKQYFYHSDHLGSASLISDYKGDEYQRIEYTPYGETWVEKTQNQGLEYLPYKFTAKELDEETGLYYYGARYLDPKYSMWISTDPALGEYIPKAPINEEAKRYNQNLPGMGGVFNHINGNLYHYAGNNPVKYTDPDGKKTTIFIIHANSGWEKFVKGSHVAIYFSNPGNASDGESNNPTLYDPSGSYDGGVEGSIRTPSGIFSERNTSNPETFIKSVLDRENGEYIVAYTIDTTPEQEAKMIERAMEKGDGFGFNCADNVSDVMKQIGFKHVLTPGALEKQLQQSSKVTETEVFKNETEN